MQVKAGSLASLQWIDVAFNASVALPPSASAAALVSFIVAEGHVNSSSLLSPQGERVEILGVNATNSSAATVSAQGSAGGPPQVGVLLPGVYLTMTSTYTSVLAGQPLVGVTDYVFAGTLALQATLGCPADCGPHGRCAPADDGAACQCACGWAGAQCDVPSGFCPEFPSEGGSAAATCPVVAPAPPPAPPAPCAGTSGAASCSSFQQYNASVGACTCLPGWSGPGCDACASDSACSTFYSAVEGGPVQAECSDARVYSERTAYKAYTCSLEGTGLETLLEPGTFHVACNTSTAAAPSGASSQGATPSVEDGAYCTVGAQTSSSQCLNERV